MLKNNLVEEVEIEGIKLLLTKKKIKNLNLRIYPTTGEIRVSAPLRASTLQIKNFINSKIGWIKAKRLAILDRKIVAPPKFISGEGHFFFGKKCQLRLIENSNANAVLLKLAQEQGNLEVFKSEGSWPLQKNNFLFEDPDSSENFIEIHSKKITNLAQRKKMFDDFYRVSLRKIIPSLIDCYEKKMQVKVAQFGIKKMKTRWGTCNVKARRIWLSLELAKRPIGCLEFIVAHEMTHLFERKHNKNFFALMDSFMPNWRKYDQELKDIKIDF